jgi:hypothetical protein
MLGWLTIAYAGVTLGNTIPFLRSAKPPVAILEPAGFVIAADDTLR